jgi:histidinol phosphatase-like PHP family hydrolase
MTMNPESRLDDFEDDVKVLRRNQTTNETLSLAGVSYEHLDDGDGDMDDEEEEEC